MSELQVHPQEIVQTWRDTAASSRRWAAVAIGCTIFSAGLAQAIDPSSDKFFRAALVANASFEGGLAIYHSLVSNDCSMRANQVEAAFNAGFIPDPFDILDVTLVI
jgi:hypothetical protein